ncbi:MAG: septum formation initiator family protein [Bacteroidales bacterium]|nr:septum formation initiator family protein [Bacteroidales bacterium]
MAKDKGDKDMSRSFFRYAAVVTALIAVFLFLKKDNVLTWIQAGFTLRKQQRQIEWYQEDNRRLDEHMRVLKQQRDSLEQFAREEFYFAAPGEDVYIVEEQ